MNTRNLILAAALTLILSVAMLFAEAQCSTSSGLQIPDTAYTNQVAEFANSSIKRILRTYSGIYNPPTNVGTIPLSTFFNFVKNAPRAVTGLKIYFGANDEQVGSGQRKLVVIFVFTKQIGEDFRSDDSNYYVYDSARQSIDPITQAEAQALHRRFRLLPNIHSLETHLLWYSIDRLDNWVEALDCQRRTNPATNPPIRDMIFDWAAYNKVMSHPHTHVPMHVMGRLTLLFKVPNATPMPLAFDGGYDTAVPCPPGTNCIDGLDG